MFDNLPLHDVTLESLHFAWKDGQVVLHLSGHGSSAATLTFDGVSELNVPRRLDWGPSVSINNVHMRHPGAFDIEMQTGDVISISATSWSFKPPAVSAQPEGAPWPSGVSE